MGGSGGLLQQTHGGRNHCSKSSASKRAPGGGQRPSVLPGHKPEKDKTLFLQIKHQSERKKSMRTSSTVNRAGHSSLLNGSLGMKIGSMKLIQC